MFKRLAKQLKTERVENNYFPMSSPVNSLKEQTKSSFLRSLSKHALNLYERKTDINNCHVLCRECNRHKSGK